MRIRSLGLLALISLAACGDSDTPVEETPDAGATDAAVADAQTSDAAKPDASPADASVQDATISDASDAATQDAMVADAATSDASDASADAGTLDPSTFKGLSIWLEASKGVTKGKLNEVSAWADQSGKGNDATQGKAPLQPTWTPNAIGGLPAVHFSKSGSGTLLTAKDSSSLQWGTGDWLVEIVARFDNVATDGTQLGAGVFFAKGGSANGVVLLGNDVRTQTAGLLAGIGSKNWWASSGSYNDGKARNIAILRSGSTLEMRVAGATVATVTQNAPIDVSAPAEVLCIGKLVYGPNDLWWLNGDIAEIVGVVGSVTPANLKSLENYFAKKYGL